MRQLRWFGPLLKMPFRCLPVEVFQARFTGGGGGGGFASALAAGNEVTPILTAFLFEKNKRYDLHIVVLTYQDSCY